MATFFTAAKDSQCEVNHLPMSKNRKKSPTKYRHVCFYCGGGYSVGIQQTTAAMMMMQSLIFIIVCNAVLLMRYMSLMRRRNKIIKSTGRNASRTKINKEI